MSSNIKGIGSGQATATTAVKRPQNTAKEQASSQVKNEESSVVTNVAPEIKGVEEAESLLDGLLGSVQAADSKALDAQGSGLNEARILDLLSED